MEQNKTIEEQNKSLGKMEKRNVKVVKRLSTAKTELQNQEHKAKDEVQQAQRLLYSQASVITELTQREKKVGSYSSYRLNRLIQHSKKK